MIAYLTSYTKMKESGIPWLGQLPEHWGLKRAKWLFRKMDRPVLETDEVMTCFRDGTVTLRKNRRVRGFTESLKEIGYQGVRRGDLVIHAMDAFAGAIGVADSNGKGTPVYSVCEPMPPANAHYYAHLVREMARSMWIHAQAKGIRERSTDFRFNEFGSQQVPLPPLAEQAAIVRFLDHYDRKIRRYIRAKQKLIKLLEEEKQAIIHRAVTRGFDPNVRLKPSGVEWLGDIPEHWEVWQIGHFARVGNGSTPSRGNSAYWDEGYYPWLNSAYANQDTITQADQFVTATALRECHLPIVPPSSVLVAITGQGKTRGKASVLRIEATINQHLAFITPRAKVASANYLKLALHGAYPQLRSISDDSGSTKGALTCADLRHFHLALPPLPDQEVILKAVEDKNRLASTAIDRAHREIQLLREFRTRLNADVVTGKLDVREAAARLLEEAEELELLEETDALPDDEEDAADNLDAIPEEAEV